MNNIELFLEKAKHIKLLALDFDGTISDGFVNISESGDILKRISFKDIFGLHQLKKNNFIVAVISGDKTPIIDTFAYKLKLEDVYQGIRNKEEILQNLAEKYEIKLENICFAGDDINDIAALQSVGLPVTVANAYYKVRELPGVFVTKADGGNGAIREITDLLLQSQR